MEQFIELDFCVLLLTDEPTRIPVFEETPCGGFRPAGHVVQLPRPYTQTIRVPTKKAA